MKPDTMTLPAYWASALINGDYSSLEDKAEIERVKAFARKYDFVDCTDEPRFTWSYNLYDIGAEVAGGEVLDYTFLVA